MTDAGETRAPRAFRLDEARIDTADDAADAADDGATGIVPVEAPRPRVRAGLPWGRLAFGAIGALATLAIGLAVSNLIAALFATEGWLGWVALGLAGIAALGVAGIAIRELFGIARVSRLRHIRETAGAAVVTEPAARRVVAALDRLYAARHELAPARREVAAHDREIVDPRDRLLIAERAYMPVLDAEARRLIGDAAKRVSIVTAVSPVAAIDLGFVLVAQLGLIRRIAALYGARPGGLGLVRLARMVIAHLAVTGGIALGDDLIQQIVGHGLAARLSARLGEGVLNGLLTARVGIAALDLIRPLPFVAERRPRVTDFASLARSGAGPAGRADTAG